MQYVILLTLSIVHVCYVIITLIVIIIIIIIIIPKTLGHCTAFQIGSIQESFVSADEEPDL